MANTANGFAAEEEGQDRLQEHPTSYEELIEKVGILGTVKAMVSTPKLL